MRTAADLKSEHSDLTRALEDGVRREQEERQKLQGELAALQEQAEGKQRTANASIGKILQERERQNRRKTEIEGALKWIEERDKEKAELERAQVAAQEGEA